MSEHKRVKQNADSWNLKHILSVNQFNRDLLCKLFDVVDTMKKTVEEGDSNKLLSGKILANAFYEPSTRTSCSFQAAMYRLGGSVICIDEASSSAKKGESLSDTIKCLECYADVIVLRHHIKGSAQLAANAASIPLLNAGDGTGEHPTQALLDLYTIYTKFQDFELKGKTITMIGDLKNGRTVHSLARILSLFDVTLNYVSPDILQMPPAVIEEIKRKGVKQNQTANLADVIECSDVLYVTRIQKERFHSFEEYESVKSSYCITLKTLENAKKNAIVMHPLPRVDEIHPEVDNDPRAVYFQQMRNGMFVRMALLALVLGRA